MTEMTYPHIQWYATRLARIPNVLDKADGQRACVEIGEEIHARWGVTGLRRTHQYYSDNIDGLKATHIATAWQYVADW